MNDPYSERTLDFVIRIWLEEKPQRDQPLRWRGYVIQVMSGHKKYFQDLELLQEFIKSQIATWCEADDQEPG